MRDHQTEQLMKDINAAIPDNIRIVRDEDIERSVNRLDELNVFTVKLVLKSVFYP